MLYSVRTSAYRDAIYPYLVVFYLVLHFGRLLCQKII